MQRFYARVHCGRTHEWKANFSKKEKNIQKKNNNSHWREMRIFNFFFPSLLTLLFINTYKNYEITYNLYARNIKCARTIRLHATMLMFHVQRINF